MTYSPPPKPTSDWYTFHARLPDGREVSSKVRATSEASARIQAARDLFEKYRTIFRPARLTLYE